MRISDWSSDVCSSDLRTKRLIRLPDGSQKLQSRSPSACMADADAFMNGAKRILVFSDAGGTGRSYHASLDHQNQQRRVHFLLEPRSEEHTSELQSLMPISYAVFCLKKKNKHTKQTPILQIP